MGFLKWHKIIILGQNGHIIEILLLLLFFVIYSEHVNLIAFLLG